MKTRQIISELDALMREVNADRLPMSASKQVISAYGPVLSIARQDSKYICIPFKVLIKEGEEPEDCFWVSLESLPDCVDVIADVYKSVLA